MEETDILATTRYYLTTLNMEKNSMVSIHFEDQTVPKKVPHVAIMTHKYDFSANIADNLLLYIS